MAARGRGALAAPRFAPLRRRQNWTQLLEFAAVGASGYVVNLTSYSLLLRNAGVHYVAAATLSFAIAVSWNYVWNRAWTFRSQRGRFGRQGLRFFLVAITAYGANIAVLALLVAAGAGKIAAQAIAIVLVTPINFMGNKLWTFRRARSHD